MARGEGSVVVRIIGEIKDLAAKLRQGEGEIGKFATSSKNLIRKSFDDITSIFTSRFGAVGKEADKALGSIADSATASGSAVGLGVGAGAAVAGAALVKMGVDGIKSFVDLASQVRQFQRLSGATAEDSSRMVAALKMLGLDADTGATGLFRLSRAVADHADTLKADGVAIARNRDGSVDLLQTLLNVSDAYRQVGAGAEGNKIAFDAFGRSGAALIPLLAAGHDQLRQFFEAAKEHGEILNQDDLDKAKQFQRSLRELHQAVEGLEISLGKGLVPAVASTVREFTELIDFANKAAKPIGGLAGVVKGLVAVVNPAAGVFDLFRGKSKDTADAAKDQADANSDLGDSFGGVEDGAASAKSVLDDYAAALDTVKDSTIGVEDAQDAVTNSLLSLQDEAERSAKSQADAAQRRADAIQSATERLADVEESAANRIADAQQRVADAREEAGKINKPGQQRDEANKRLSDAEKELGKTQRDANRDIVKAREELAKASKAVTDETDKWEPSLDRSTIAGLKNRKVFSDIVDEAFKVAEEMKKQGKPAADILAYLLGQAATIDAIGSKLGFARTQLKEFEDLLANAGGVGVAQQIANLPPVAGAAAVSGLAGQGVFFNYTQNVYGFAGDVDALARSTASQIDRQLRRRG